MKKLVAKLAAHARKAKAIDVVALVGGSTGAIG